jgi:hypothetical protein
VYESRQLPEKMAAFHLPYCAVFRDKLKNNAGRKRSPIMNAANETKMTEVKINPDNLYKEDSFTDLTYATIRRLTPIKIDGSIDESREVIFTGIAQLMSPNGPVPVQCLIEGAKNLSEAAAKFPEAIEKTVQAMIAEAKEMQRKEASRIVIPGH